MSEHSRGPNHNATDSEAAHVAESQYLAIHHISIKNISRIFAKIKIDSATNCWNASGAAKNGYGRISFKGREIYLHRLLYAWLVEPLPSGLAHTVPQLDHAACNNRRCCNPSHLKLVTQQENIARAAALAKPRTCPSGHTLPPAPNRADGSRRCNECKRLYAAGIRRTLGARIIPTRGIMRTPRYD